MNLRGEGPRIVFSKPDPAEQLIAREPNQNGFGQSPDDGDAVLDLVLKGELAPSPSERESADSAGGCAQVTRTLSTLLKYGDSHNGGDKVSYGYQPPATLPQLMQSPPPQTSFPQPARLLPEGVPGPSGTRNTNTATWGGSAIGATSPGAIDYGRIPTSLSSNTDGCQQPVAQPQAAPTTPSGYAQ